MLPDTLLSGGTVVWTALRKSILTQNTMSFIMINFQNHALNRFIKNYL